MIDSNSNFNHEQKQFIFDVSDKVIRLIENEMKSKRCVERVHKPDLIKSILKIIRAIVDFESRPWSGHEVSYNLNHSDQER